MLCGAARPFLTPRSASCMIHRERALHFGLAPTVPYMHANKNTQLPNVEPFISDAQT